MPKVSNATGFAAESEAAAGISKRMRKHLMWFVPLVTGLALTTVVRCNKGPKELVENLMPGYIDFVREHWGFDEEELEEDYRRSRLQAELSLPLVVTVSIRGQERSDSLTVTVSGSASEAELMALIKKEHPAFFSSLSDAPVQLSFPAGGARLVASAEDGQSMNGQTGESAAEVEDARMQKILLREHNAMIKNLALVQRVQDCDEAWVSSVSMWKGTESKWHTVPGSASEQKQRIQELLALANAPSKDPFLDGGATGMRLALMVPFQNYAVHAAHGLQSYRSQYIGSSEYSALQVLIAQGRTIQSWVSTAKIAAAGQDRSSKADAMRHLEHLEGRLALFKRELKSGTNPMKSYDASLKEIADTEAEIRELRRRYGSWFSFWW